MPKNQNSELPRTLSKKAIMLVDYKPAELRKGLRWVIVYYAKNPLTGKMDRHRLEAPMMKNARERERHANRIISELNKKLADGWSPWLEENGANGFKSYNEACKRFLSLMEKEIEDGIKREDTRRTYKSFLNMFNTFLKEKRITLKFAVELKKDLFVSYLDWVYYDRNNSPRTYNNHLYFFRGFCDFLVERSFLLQNPTTEILDKRVVKKKRAAISERSKEVLRKNLPLYNRGYFTLCMTNYFSLIRRTELTKIQVQHIDLFKSTILITGENSKNTMTEAVTIPAELKPLLQRHIEGANKFDYVFSAVEFKPGPKKLTPKKISDIWSILRKRWELPTDLQWYDLKRTGITDMLKMGMASYLVQNQARHKSITTTELYVASLPAGDEKIVNSGLKF